MLLIGYNRLILRKDSYMIPIVWKPPKRRFPLRKERAALKRGNCPSQEAKPVQTKKDNLYGKETRGGNRKCFSSNGYGTTWGTSGRNS